MAICETSGDAPDLKRHDPCPRLCETVPSNLPRAMIYVLSKITWVLKVNLATDKLDPKYVITFLMKKELVIMFTVIM